MISVLKSGQETFTIREILYKIPGGVKYKVW